MPWCAQGRYLPGRPIFTLDPLLHAGAYYVQEASSMLLERAFQRTGLAAHDVLALDLCAAPGGKSTHLAALLARGSLLVSNEPVAARQAALLENLWKQGLPHVVITGSTPEDMQRGAAGAFDLVLVDAPCSGEGMFRKDPFARTQWSERLVSACAGTQAGILDAAWALLAPGGHLIYSTCTWEPAENERQVARMLERGALPLPLGTDPAWGIEEGPLGCRCYPHRLRGEGLFMALLRKPGGGPARTTGSARTVAAGDPHPWIGSGFAVCTHSDADAMYAIPAAWYRFTERLRRDVHLLSAGVPVAERKGAGWRPHPALALSTALAREAFPAMDLDRDAALAFLRGETSIPGTPPPGPDHPGMLVRYQGLGLGWLHPAGGRWNNGWPKPWRIRMR